MCVVDYGDTDDERLNFRYRKPIEYDPDFKGPLKNRSCTDVICLLLFIIFIACWVAIGIWAIKNGDPETLLAPRDSQGRRCGIDIKDKPYLFFFDLTKCISPTVPFVGCDTPQVCVKNCPRDNFLYMNPIYSTNSALPYCKDGTTGYDPQNCPTWILQSEPFQKRCIPSLGSIDANFLAELDVSLNQSHNFVSNMYTAISNIKLLAEAEQVADQVVGDVISAWWKILIGVGLALVACIIYILMLRWIAGVMVWISIVGVIVALTAATYFSCTAWQHWNTSYNEDPTNNAFKTKKNLFLALFIIVVIVFAIVLLVLIFLRKRIVLAIALIKEGSRAVSSVTSILFFPILPWILQVGVVAYAICIGVYLATTGDPFYQIRNVSPDCHKDSQWSNGTECNPSNFTNTHYSDCINATCKFTKIANEAFYPYLQAINVFGFFWLAFFVSALGQMVLSQVFAQWYWTFRKSNLPFFAISAAFYRTVRYHLGTLAFGSLIIAICRMIRVCLEYLDHKLKKYDNQLVRAILCCLKCFFWCLEKFLKFINKNAYIMCAIHGKNFCASAKDAFMLLMRNIVRVFVLDKVTDFLFFLSKVLVTVGVGAVAYLFFATDLIPFMNNSQLNYGIVPVIIIMIVTYLIASLFFSVYSMAVDTLFLCFLEDCERNDGSPTKPYYMSKNLMKIFGKKNVRPKRE